MPSNNPNKNIINMAYDMIYDLSSKSINLFAWFWTKTIFCR